MNEQEYLRIRKKIYGYVNSGCRIKDCPACTKRVGEIFDLVWNAAIKEPVEPPIEPEPPEPPQMRSVFVSIGLEGAVSRRTFVYLRDSVASANVEHEDFTKTEILEVAFQDFLHRVIGEIRKQADHHEEDSFWTCGRGFHL